jgi:thiol-disulfide isomerase/thioredoxin
MWIQSTCSFCTASLPFYRDLSAEVDNGVRVVAMGPEPEDTIRAYLQDNRVSVDQVIGAPQDVRLYSTPTLLLLEPGLKIASIWVGKLEPTAESDLRAALRIYPAR